MNEYHSGLATPVISPSAEPTGSVRRIDAVAVLTLYLFMLLFIPYSIVFSPLGGSGGPSTMFAALIMGLYLILWLRPAFGLDRGTQPIRVVALIFMCVILASYVSANRHALPILEQNGADRGLISVFGWIGVLLLAADGIDRSDRLRTMIRRIVLGVAGMAMIGLIQFFAGLDLTKYIFIPGFAKVAAYGIVDRNGLIGRRQRQPIPSNLLQCWR